MESTFRTGIQAVKGLVAACITLPVMPILLAGDISRSLRYANKSEEIGYDPKKPTPNTVDFPDGPPESNRTLKYIKRVSDWAFA